MKSGSQRGRRLWIRSRLLSLIHILFEYDGEVDLGNATTDEVAQVAWMNREPVSYTHLDVYKRQVVHI